MSGNLVLVCGSRSWTDTPAILNRLSELPAGTEVVHGGARGADTIAGYAARYHGFTERRMLANWAMDGKRAGVMRNLAMLDLEPSLVLAFWDERSPGTRHTVTEARRRGIPVEVVAPAVPDSATRGPGGPPGNDAGVSLEETRW